MKIAVGTTNRAKLESVETAAGQMFSAHSVWPCAADRSGATITFHTPCVLRHGSLHLLPLCLTSQVPGSRSGVSDQPMSVDETSALLRFSATIVYCTLL